METKIISLTCPNCGSSDQSIDQKHQFGFDFKCKHCGSTSVLIINNRLYVPLPGERICRECGRVAPSSARFCQCGKPLVKKCTNLNCQKEFPIDHEICDFCGYKHLDSIEYFRGGRTELVNTLHEIKDPKNEFIFALAQLTNPDTLIREQSQMYINNLIIKCDNINLIEYMIEGLEKKQNEFKINNINGLLEIARKKEVISFRGVN